MKILSFDVGIVNLAYCIFDTNTCKILNWEVIGLENNNNYNKVYINLIEELDKRTHLIDHVDIVIIEKQPSFNPKMRIIAGCLQTYFIIRGIVDSKPDNIIKSLNFFSPKHKLKCYSGPELKLDSVIKSKYSRTKKMGILICRSKLYEYNETEENIELFEKSKKKDDLSDCYLQAITYSLFQKLIKVSEFNQEIPVKNLLKKITKTEIKNQIKELLTSNETSLIESIINNLPSDLKNNIEDKYSLSFPMDLNSIEKLLSSMNLKKFMKLK